MDFDAVIFDSLSELVGGSLTSWSRCKAALPIKLGGVGLRLASEHSPAIFLASVIACSPLILSLSGQEVPPSYVSAALAALASSADLSDLTSISDLDLPISQKSLSGLIDRVKYSALLSSTQDIRSKALLLSSSIPHAGDWLGVLPSPNIGLHLLDCEFRLCLRYWLGVQLSSDTTDCPFCSRPADVYGDHALACGGSSERVSRHNALRDVIFSAAQAAALSPRREIPYLVPDSLSRPADVFLPSWLHGRPAALDVTVVSPLQAQVIQQAASVQGSALSVAEQRKRSVHLADCQRVGVSFLPMAVESLGGWSRDALSTIRLIGHHLGTRIGLPPKDVSHHLLQRLSVTLWRFNAQMWLNRSPTVLPLVDGLL